MSTDCKGGQGDFRIIRYKSIKTVPNSIVRTVVQQ